MARTVLAPPHEGRPAHQLASVDEVAAYAQVHPKTVRRWLADGLLTRYNAGPRLIRLDLDEVDTMLRGGT
jgi:excisionase family DNA binding protein